jgi:hypothetical protein
LHDEPCPFCGWKESDEPSNNGTFVITEFIPATSVTYTRPLRERGILFSAPMVRAILAGTKTQTRRVVKPQAHVIRSAEPDASQLWEAFDEHGKLTVHSIECPYGMPGDKLWVKETFSACRNGAKHPDCIDYRADQKFTPGHDDEPTWKPSIYMPRSLSRITLEVVDVRVERLQSISASDACAEGVIDATHGWDGNVYYPRARYMELWKSINDKRPGCSWADSPWVWCISFKRMQS